MKLALGRTLSILFFSAPLAFVACGGDDDEGPLKTGGTHAGGNASGGAGGAADDGAMECKVVGELCHEADTGSGPGHDCHELGHENDPAACAAGFAKCIDLCVPSEGAGGAANERDPKCAALGELCHAVDDKDGPLHDCHELGHDGDAAKCAAGFDACATKCLAARELLDEHPSGGAAGAGGATTTAGGAAGAAGAPAAGGAGAGGSP